jgi:hypothetical protein
MRLSNDEQTVNHRGRYPRELVPGFPLEMRL